MTIGSLFSGIGGLELGLERAGLGTVRWQVEISAFCRYILGRHWPDVERFDDVRTVGAHNLAPVDVFCGGFPCQDLSPAGKRAGLQGERSGLVYEFLRLVSALAPRWVVIENVAHTWARWVPVVRRELWTRGYASVPLRIRACDVGARHERARIFLVASPDADLVERVERAGRAGEGSPGRAESRGGAPDPLRDPASERRIAGECPDAHPALFRRASTAERERGRVDSAGRWEATRECPAADPHSLGRSRERQPAWAPALAQVLVPYAGRPGRYRREHESRRDERGWPASALVEPPSPNAHDQGQRCEPGDERERRGWPGDRTPAVSDAPSVGYPFGPDLGGDAREQACPAPGRAAHHGNPPPVAPGFGRPPRPWVVRGVHGLPGGVDGPWRRAGWTPARLRAARVAALGNAVVSDCAEVVGRLIMAAELARRAA